jgi:5-methylcytosine-specific restriction endonuclease McrA
VARAKKPPLSSLSREEYEKRLKKIILAGLGKAWMFWPPRLEAKKRAKHPTKPGWYICEVCNGEREKIEIDHMVPCIRPSEGFKSWDDYISSRFVFSDDKLQALCHECHKEKSKRENKIRREAKKGESNE